MKGKFGKKKINNNKSQEAVKMGEVITMMQASATQEVEIKAYLLNLGYEDKDVENLMVLLRSFNETEGSASTLASISSKITTNKELLTKFKEMVSSRSLNETKMIGIVKMTVESVLTEYAKENNFNLDNNTLSTSADMLTELFKDELMDGDFASLTDKDYDEIEGTIESLLAASNGVFIKDEEEEEHMGLLERIGLEETSDNAPSNTTNVSNKKEDETDSLVASLGLEYMVDSNPEFNPEGYKNAKPISKEEIEYKVMNDITGTKTGRKHNKELNNLMKLKNIKVDFFAFIDNSKNIDDAKKRLHVYLEKELRGVDTARVEKAMRGADSYLEAVNKYYKKAEKLKGDIVGNNGEIISEDVADAEEVVSEVVNTANVETEVKPSEEVKPVEEVVPSEVVVAVDTTPKAPENKPETKPETKPVVNKNYQFIDEVPEDAVVPSDIKIKGYTFYIMNVKNPSAAYSSDMQRAEKAWAKA